MSDRYLAGIPHEQAQTDGDQAVNSCKNHDIVVMVDGRNRMGNPGEKNDGESKNSDGKLGDS
jgi:hypothetical protein